MGVLQRFERRLEGLVEGAFAHVFKGVVEPVEVATALQREAGDHKAILGQGRVLVPNRYVVELAATDHERLATYAEPLAQELAIMVSEHLKEMGWTTFGKIRVKLEQSPNLHTGVFRVSSSVDAIQTGAIPVAPTGARLIDGGSRRDFPLRRGITVIGRGDEADIRLPDTGVSRRHAEVSYDGDTAVVRDLGSTNGTLINGQLVAEQVLRSGDHMQMGSLVLIFRADT
ncbi:MAG: FhaA domain-containing protein [Pseudonocardiales bacterium]